MKKNIKPKEDILLIENYACCGNCKYAYHWKYNHCVEFKCDLIYNRVYCWKVCKDYRYDGLIKNDRLIKEK